MDFDTGELEDLQAVLIRSNFELFCELALAPFGQKPAAHHRLLIRKLQAVADGKIARLMVLMPPGSAKSTYVSKLFAAWYLARRRRALIIAASHTADLAEKISKEVQQYATDMSAPLGYNPATQSASGWQATNGGEYKAAGVGGPITGRRANLGLIDDPVKGPDDVANETQREKAWDWYNKVFRSRLTPKAPVVLVMTRWHQDDLGGRLLSAQRDMWDVVSLPAQAIEDDPLGREPGEWLWSDDAYGYAADLQQVKAEFELNGAMRAWGALYQQNPQPAEGALFKIANIRLLPACPPISKEVRAWDLASTEQVGSRDPDWTAGVRLARLQDGTYCIRHVARDRGGPNDTLNLVKGTTQQDGRGVRVGLPQDPGQAGKFQVAYITRELAGFYVESSPETGDKETRAGPVASQCNVGNISIVADGPNGELSGWARRLLDELAAFPTGVKDDQVDALSRAFMMLSLAPPPMKVSAEAVRASMRNLRR